jgi:glyoxylase-like metal-dependent hydrolase (beta-lactamase superfamily II)
MKHANVRLLLAISVAVFALAVQAAGSRTITGSPSQKVRPPQSLRLYVFDCGILHNSDAARYRFNEKELATLEMSVACFLIAHPSGTLVWDTGAVPDNAWTPTGTPTNQHIVLPDGQQRNITVVKSLKGQLAQLGYSPADINSVALSHYHYDHTANANEFAGATWLVRQIEHDAMLAEKGPATTQPSTYAALRNSKTIILKTDEYDVFTDGSVIIKSAPGHTPGHQVLYVKLTKTGGVMLSGDLYHYPEERKLNRVPTFDFDEEQTRASRVMIEAFLKNTVAQLWIQHDIIANAKLKKSPNFYD